MKKSTLITTIAMIVVVVVALSTATYAWFSSSTSAVATSATITTSAAGDWTIAKATLTGSDFVVGQAQDVITLNSTGLNSGLFSPVGKIATTFDNSSVGVSGSITTKTEFIEARKTGNNNVYNATAGQIAPDILKLSNAKQNANTLKMSVVLNAGPDTTKVSSFYACAAVRFYAVFEVMDVTTDPTHPAYTKYVVSNAYDYASTVGYSDTSLTVSAERSGGTTYEKNAGTVSSDAGANYSVISNINYLQAATVTGVDAQFKTPDEVFPVDTDLTKYGVQETDYIYVYNYTLPMQVGVGQSTNVLIYTWIDGWQAASEAAGSSFTVNYAFNTAS